MGTKDLDKLLDVVGMKLAQVYPRSEAQGVTRVVKYAMGEPNAEVKFAAFAEVSAEVRKHLDRARIAEQQNEMLLRITGNTYPRFQSPRRPPLVDVANFCEKVMLYYMLKGCGCENEIADIKELDVITGVLR